MFIADCQAALIVVIVFVVVVFVFVVFAFTFIGFEQRCLSLIVQTR